MEVESNYRLDIAYDGTDYCGYQIQPNGNTIEAELRKALNKKDIRFKKLTASGRTDSGVHANQQTITFFSDTYIPDHQIKYALNTVLPESIRVIESSMVPNTFNARFSTKGKHYIYSIDLSKIASPLNSRYSWNFPYRLDFNKLEEASSFLSGKHDYRAFMASGSDIKDTVREIYKIYPEISNNILNLHFFGNGFLYNMVRILTGTILQYASGQLDRSTLDKVFSEPDRRNAGITAPAKGLRLEEVFYREEDLKNSLKKFS